MGHVLKRSLAGAATVTGLEALDTVSGLRMLLSCVSMIIGRALTSQPVRRQ